jgi:uncharacterized protein YukE
MPLDLTVKGDPVGLRETGRWLRSTAEQVRGCDTAVRQSAASSQGEWVGSAGDAFRGVMGKMGPRIDEVAADLTGTARALETYANALDSVNAQMGQARQVADNAGLVTTDTTIVEPGAAPAEPAPLPGGGEATEQQRQTHTAAVQAQQAHAAKVAAYHQAAQVVDGARKKETESQGALNNFLSGFVEKLPFTMTDFAAGLAGAVAIRTSAFRQTAAQAAARAARAANLMHSPNLNFRNQTRAAIIHARNSVNAAEASRQATATRLARAVDHMPRGLKGFVTANVSETMPVLRRIPLAGTLITGAGVGYDISQGRNPVQAAASGVGGLLAGAYTGAAVGAAFGGPIGAVAGGVVSVGVGFVIDEWGDDIARGAGDAAGWVGDRVDDIGEGISGLGKKLFG